MNLIRTSIRTLFARQVVRQGDACHRFASLSTQGLTLQERCRLYSSFTYLPLAREGVVIATKSARQNERKSDIDRNKKSIATTEKTNKKSRKTLNKRIRLWKEANLDNDEKYNEMYTSKVYKEEKKEMESHRKISNEKIDEYDIDKLMKICRMEDPKAIEYPLHTMNKISDVITRSIIARRKLSFVESLDSFKEILIPRKLLEDTCNNIVPHNALYFRIIDISQTSENTPASSSSSSPYKSEVRIASSENNNNNNSSSSNSNNKLQSMVLSGERELHESISPELIKYVWDGVKNVLRDYAVHAYSPFNGEWVCDVTHYCDIKTIVVAARKSLKQFERDAEMLLSGATVPEKHGFAGEVDVRNLPRLRVEKLVAEIACRIRDEVLNPLIVNTQSEENESNDINDRAENDSNNNNSSNSDTKNSGSKQEESEFTEEAVNGARESLFSGASEVFSTGSARQLSKKFTSIPSTLKICIGVGTSPFWAKLACDTEVRALSKNAGNDSAPVHIRSFHKYTQNAESRKEFMGKFNFAELPIVKPAFSKFFRDAFGIVKCSDILRFEDELQHSVSAETFKFCYIIAHGCAELPGEKNAMLVMQNINTQVSPLLETIASNSISLTNANRTVFGNPANYVTIRFRNRGAKIINCLRVYGRLISDRQFVELVAKVTTRNILTLHKICKKCSRLRIDFYRDGRNIDNAEVKFKPTADFDTILAHSVRLAKSCADKREHVGKPIKGNLYSVCVQVATLEPIIMIPPSCQREIDQITKRYTELRKLLRSHRFRYYRKHFRTPKLKREKAKQENKVAEHDAKVAVRRSSSKTPIITTSSRSKRAIVHRSEKGRSSKAQLFAEHVGVIGKSQQNFKIKVVTI